MDKRYYPISEKLFRGEIQPLIDKHYAAPGRPYETSDYQVFNVILFLNK